MAADPLEEALEAWSARQVGHAARESDREGRELRGADLGLSGRNPKSAGICVSVPEKDWGGKPFTLSSTGRTLEPRRPGNS